METNNENRAESQYNLNERITTLIADIQEKAFILSNAYKFNASFDKWQSIRLLIEARFNKDEIKELNELEESFSERIIVAYPIVLSIQRPMHGLSQRDNYIRIEGLKIKKDRLNKYIKCIMKLMRAYKIGLTDKEKKVRLT